MLAPSRANWKADARPIPLLEAHTMAVLPLMPRSMALLPESRGHPNRFPRGVQSPFLVELIAGEAVSYDGVFDERNLFHETTCDGGASSGAPLSPFSVRGAGEGARLPR